MRIAILPCFLFGMAAGPLAPKADAFTQITITNGPDAKTDAAATFGMIFKPGDVPAGTAPVAAGTTLQVDAKATHADGSLRHAVVTVKFASLAPNQSKTFELTAGTAAAGAPIAVGDVLKTAFDAKVSATIAGVEFSASARDYLAQGKVWLAGPLCTEWIVTAPLKNAAGVSHPHLHAVFAIRAYQGLKNIRADVTMENDWAFEPVPAGFTYDAKITVGGAVAYTKSGLAHTHHSRWRKVLWWGGDPDLDTEYDNNYLFSTGAFPYYDRNIKVSPSAITALPVSFEPMSTGSLSNHMPTTGAQDDIGPLPNFAAIYLLTMDGRVRKNVLANGNCGGTYHIHYRHKPTDLPVSLDDFPYMTLLGNPPDTRNPKTDKLEAFPDVVNGLESTTPDDAHQPSIAYLPYLISGDYFYLEELQFWANWNMILANPGYRDMDKGLLKWGQVRAQAWSMRTLGQAAYITPDNHPLKKYFVNKINNNIDWYTAQYVGKAGANAMGYLEGQYPYEPFGIAPWMDDFFTWSLGFLNQLGFSTVKPLLAYKSKFVVGRLTDPGYCWLQASVYTLQVGTAAKVPYKSFSEIYKANYPNGACTGLKMDGYPEQPDGYGANMQPALAVAVDAGIPGAADAWAKYQTRVPKQNYSTLPEFAVVPKGSSGSFVRGLQTFGNSERVAFSRLMLPGTAAFFRTDFRSEVFVELFDTSGRQIAAFGLGRLDKGRHALDWRKGPDGAPVDGMKPCLVRIKAVDDFKHSEFLGISTTEGSAAP